MIRFRVNFFRRPEVITTESGIFDVFIYFIFNSFHTVGFKVYSYTSILKPKDRERFRFGHAEDLAEMLLTRILRRLPGAILKP